MLQNAYFLAKFGADTAENEQHFAEILPIGRRVADRARGAEHDLELVASFMQVYGRSVRAMSLHPQLLSQVVDLITLVMRRMNYSNLKMNNFGNNYFGNFWKCCARVGKISAILDIVLATTCICNYYSFI